MDCSPPGSSVCGISQARVLEGVAISSSKGYSQPKNGILVSCLAGGFFPTEPPGKPVLLDQPPKDEAKNEQDNIITTRAGIS